MLRPLGATKRGMFYKQLRLLLCTLSSIVRSVRPTKVGICMPPLGHAPTSNLAGKFSAPRSKCARNNHGVTMGDSHKAVRRKRRKPPVSTGQGASNATKGVSVVSEEPKKAKKLKGIAPHDVLTAILNIKRDKALVNLQDEGSVLPWLRNSPF
jgi:hypothetical protein